MNTDKERNGFDSFLESYLQELQIMSDEEVLGGADPAMVKANALSMLASARAQAGPRRLAIAKQRLASSQRLPTIDLVSIAEAMAYLREAANDDRYTLAARELGEMSDDDDLN